MFSRNILKYYFFLASVLLIINSCDNNNILSIKEVNKGLVINEIMVSNQTGLLAENDSLYDWIEIKNISTEAIDLDDYYFSAEKSKKAKKKKKKLSEEESDDDDFEDEDDGTEEWGLPAITLAPGKVLLIFASKKDCIEPGKELHTSFKIPAKKGKLQLMAENGDTISYVEYENLSADMSYRRLDDGTYEKSYKQSPGFENTDEGYEEYCQLIDTQRKDPLRIWEAHTKKSKDKRSSWVEIKNVSNQAVSLQDYGLACETYKDKAWQLPNKQLNPGEIYDVICSEDNIDINSSKSIALVKNGEFVDGVCGKSAPYGMSMGRVEGKSGFFYFPTPTEGRENTGKCYRFIAENPKFNYAPGVYNDSKGMVIKIESQGLKIHYTKDGSTPTMSSPLFKDSIRIDTTTVIRAFCEGDSSTYMRSNIATATYFLNVKHNLPIVNISINDDDLYNNTYGIYVSGPGGGGPYPHKGANYWKNVSKRAHIEFYDSLGSFSEDCGFAIFGGFSRALAKKSFKVQFRDQYGTDNIKFDVFKVGKAQKFKNLVLRSGSQDMGGVMSRDEFFTSLMKENSPTLLVQGYRPVALYINASYFGLYYIREKIDKHFVAQHLKVPADSINIIMSKVYNEEGPKVHFQELLSYVRNNDLTNKDAYEHMRNLVDFDGLIDQKLGQIYSGNTDVGNIRYVRSTHNKSDKKWYFVFYDTDISWRTFKDPAFYLRASGAESEGSVSMHNLFVDKLLANKDFRQLFLERLSLHMHKTFTPQNTAKVFDGITNHIKEEMKLNCKRWPSLCAYTTWEKNVQQFREKFKTRNKEMLDALRDELAITPEENKKYFGDLGI